MIVSTSVAEPSVGPGEAPAWYMALIESVPTGRLLVVRLAFEFITGRTARRLWPILKVTVPLLTSPPAAVVTVAENVTAAVAIWGLAELVSMTASCESATVSKMGEDCELAKLSSPV